MRKRLTLLFILPLYGIASLGLFTSYWALFHRASFQFRVRQGDFPELTTLTFSEEQFKSLNWTEKNQEFSWQGKMFDVSSIAKSEEGYVIVCKYDTAESFVVDLFTFEKDATDTKKVPTKDLSKWLFGKYLPLQNQFLKIELSAVKAQTYFDPITHYRLLCYEVESPPPEHPFI